MTKRDEEHSTIIGTRLQHPWSMIRNRPFGHLLPVPSTSSVGIGLGPVSRMRCKDNHHVSRSGTSSHQKDDGWSSKEKIKRITGRSNSPRETKAEEKDRRPKSLSFLLTPSHHYYLIRFAVVLLYVLFITPLLLYCFMPFHAVVLRCPKSRFSQDKLSISWIEVLHPRWSKILRQGPDRLMLLSASFSPTAVQRHATSSYTE